MLIRAHPLETKEEYLIKLRMFLEFCCINPHDFVALTREDPVKAEELVTSYILARREGLRLNHAQLRPGAEALLRFKTNKLTLRYTEIPTY